MVTLKYMAYIFKKKKEGKNYFYLAENKRVNGEVKKAWQKYLGPADRVAKKLAEGGESKEVDVLEFGLVASLLNVDEKIKFSRTVNEVIKKRNQGLSYGNHLLLSIINRIDNPQSKNKLGEWFNKTALKRLFSVNSSYLSSQNFWNHWNNISEEQIDKIQEKLLETLAQRYDISDLCYDPTNFTTHIQEHKNQEIMQFGHAKDGKKGLRQVNLSMLVTKNDGIPLWHHTYNGNVNDVTEFKEFIKKLTERVSFFSRKSKKITLVFDKGNNSKNNIKNLNKKLSLFMVGSLKPSENKEFFDIPLEEFEEVYKTSGGKKVFCTSKRKNIYDGKKKIVVTYSNELAYKNRVRVNKALKKALNQLKNLQGKLKNSNLTRDEVLIKVEKIVGKPYIKNLIKYEVYGDKRLEFSEDKEAYEELAKGFGKNILFTDDMSLKTQDVVRIYNSKEVIEEQFKNLKDTHVVRFTPMWCWTDRMIRVHAFTCVMSLLFQRILVKESNLELSQNQIIEKLKDIKLALLHKPETNEITPKVTRLDNTQKILNNSFDIKSYV